MYDIYLYRFSKDYLEDISHLKETRRYITDSFLTAFDYLDGKNLSQVQLVTEQEKLDGISADKAGWYVNIYRDGQPMRFGTSDGYWYSKGYVKPHYRRPRRKGVWRKERSTRNDGWLIKSQEKNRQICLSYQQDYPVPGKWIKSTDFFYRWDDDPRSTKGRSWKNQKIQRQWQKHLDIKTQFLES